MENCTDKQHHKHFAIYKPYGYLSQFINNGQKQNSKKLLGELYDFPEGTMAIGRLDEKSEGLLLLTTDGKMSNHICSSGNVEKEYYAQVNGDISMDAIELLKKGVEIGFEGKKYTTTPCKASKLNAIPKFPERSKKIRDDRHGPTSWVSITLKEGKFRQVRKMTSAVGFPTLRLVRIRVGGTYLDEMKAGEVRELHTL
ncbi:23S rRNA pseudouridine2457 synthase [Aquimarina sp. MAR_2010_214]|uniref:pseudouridine synthase n=1 Tax=Aquimarina sp. MAR_2010_214 TaxID=1250026 RepID=UPI000C7080D1|nr:pseudouridine synthase [Aquimarina sp. MAR_2010_214]PKV51467.1 23S rRNA pseudouridine2457 synthase [Aquimarina sp. MAR_2010_214]